MKTISGSASAEEKLENRQPSEEDMAFEEIEEAVDQVSRDPGRNPQEVLARAADHSQTATRELLDAADQASAELQEGRNTTRMLLDGLEARHGVHG
jgi:hypothetical protein